MALNHNQIKRIKSILNIFETGKPEGVYHSISIYRDGPVINGASVYQITYGRSQTTEFGNLKRLIELYIERNGLFAQNFQPYLRRLGKQPSLRSDDGFKKLLKDAAVQDPIMRTTQDEFFDMHYYQPAQIWMEGNGFTKALSMLVIYDSFIHSGGIPSFLRKRFPARTPLNGGDEKEWISQYVDTRHEWLRTHSKEILRKTIYRTKCLKDLIKATNWDLSGDIKANGVKVP